MNYKQVNLATILLKLAVLTPFQNIQAPAKKLAGLPNSIFRLISSDFRMGVRYSWIRDPRLPIYTHDHKPKLHS